MTARPPDDDGANSPASQALARGQKRSSLPCRSFKSMLPPQLLLSAQGEFLRRFHCSSFIVHLSFVIAGTATFYTATEEIRRLAHFFFEPIFSPKKLLPSLQPAPIIRAAATTTHKHR